MSTPLTEEQLAAVGAGVRLALRDVLERRLPIDEAVARQLRRLAAGDELSPRERAAQAKEERRKQMLADLAKTPDDPAAATRTARKFARDPADPIEVASLARQLRRWAKKNGQCPRIPQNQA